MRFALVLASALLGVSAVATAQVSIQIGLPSARIGVDIGGYPDLVAVPGYPVYYAPQLGTNLFFYDGLYWVFAQDQWYASSWYNGPWDLVAPESVPYFVLRVPVRYYRQPPAFFAGWGRDAPPRWGEHWGHDWDQRHGGWDRWDRASAPAPAPLPTYQRAYAGGRYPDAGQQRALRESNYHYQPHEAVVKRQFARAPTAAPPVAKDTRTARPAPSAAPPAARHGAAAEGGERHADAARAERPAPVAAAPKPEVRHAPVERPPAPRESPAASARAPAPANRDVQRRPAEEARSAPAPAARPPENRGGEPREAHAAPPPPQHQAPAARAPEAKAPEREPKKEPERERDH